ncbi:MAG: hypothetical protein KF832_03855 [Caldilineaceae bacterium]|nr:hypothetical protein [Caldilineaceae bacterium]
MTGCQLIVAEPDAPAPTATTTPMVAASLTATISVTATVAVTATTTVTVAPALTTTAPVSTTDVTTTTTAAGLQLYRQYYCGICHQSTVAETGGTFGPSHDGMGALAALRIQEPTYNGNATTAAEYLQESLLDPQRFVVPGYELTPHRMPNYNFLPTSEVDALVAWLLQQ